MLPKALSLAVHIKQQAYAGEINSRDMETNYNLDGVLCNPVMFGVVYTHWHNDAKSLLA